MLHPLLPKVYLELIETDGIRIDTWNPGSEEIGWSGKTAFQALELLQDSEVAVIGCELAYIERNCLRYRPESSYITANGSESPADYVRRSHAITREFLERSQGWAEPHEPLYIFGLTAVVV